MREAVVLAGGFGTRLSHIVSEVPKPMAPVAGRPFLCYLLDYLHRNGFEHVILSTGYMHEKIEDYFGTEYHGIRLSYARETNPLGTGGGILNALLHCQTDNVVVLNGDTLFLVDMDGLLNFHTEHHPLLTLVLRKVDNVSRYGAVCCNEQHQIVSFLEKNATTEAGFINGGIYVLNKSLFEGFRLGDRFSFETDILQSRYSQTPFFGYSSNAYFIDIGIPEDYYRAQEEFPRVYSLPNDNVREDRSLS
ncbi:MAG: nucleotidyltransferase family protein [Bacteroidales bacterium]|nr:nucleotidyltransferase family protein [Bacteroidales bacterium]